MENATKALLIASAVLVVIVIISLGLLILKNLSSASTQSNNTGKTIEESTYSVSKNIKGAKTISTEEFKNKMNNSSINNIIDRNNVRDKIIVAGFIYKKYAIRIPGQGWSIDLETCLKTKEGETFEQTSKRIIEQDIYNSSDFELAKNIYNIEEETKEYLEKKAQIPEGTTRTIYSSSPYYHFDSEGYIDEIIIVCYAGRV